MVDRDGRVLLVDLSRIDERWDANGLIPETQLFATAAASLQRNGDAGVGLDDPRIVWKSAPGVAGGTLAPVIDPDTGFVYVGKLLEKTTTVVAAIDPRIQVRADLGREGGLSEIGGIVPLGVKPPGSVRMIGDNASLAAFRLEVSLPGAISEALEPANQLVVAVESERVAGAVTEQTPEPFPRAHLRRSTRSGQPAARAANDFLFQRVVPAELAPALRHQKGFNKWISPWIVAIADPRASIDYAWGTASPEAAGCEACVRPAHLRGKRESDGVWELFTNGRLIAIRPDLCASGTTNCASNVFTGTRYAYLGEEDRLVARVATVMADTVRAPEVLVAAQNPAVAGGMLQETTYLHSGELETSNVDLVAGGRAGWDVLFDRTYRSRTIGATLLGQGWDSTIFRRLRPLPNGDVEYRDGTGEVWRYEWDEEARTFLRPKGLFLNLARTAHGWTLVDQQWRVTGFDTLGRLIHEADEFAPNPYAADAGNIIRYLYDASGRLLRIVDPVGRESTLAYDGEGRLARIKDWRERVVDFAYDANGRLLTAALPEVENTDHRRPTIRYGYATPGGTYNDRLELGDLTAITDLKDVERVRFTYGQRDKVTRQDWKTGENARFEYGDRAATVHDALGQKRTYALTAAATNAGGDRPHVTRVDEADVPAATFAFGVLPAATFAAPPRNEQETRTFQFTHDAEGQLLTSKLDRVRETTYEYTSVEPAAPGFVLKSTRTTPLAGPASEPITRTFHYAAGANRNTFLRSVSAASGAGTLSVQMTRPSLKARSDSATNDAIVENVSVDEFGLTRSVTSAGGRDAAGAGATAILDYVPATGALHARGLLASVDRGGLVSSVEYVSPRVVRETDERQITTETTLDAWLRPTEVATSGSPLTLRETVRYDANGRAVTTDRLQAGVTVVDTIDYDELGRVKRSATNNVAVGTALGEVETTIAYDLPNRTITRTLPGGATITEKLDGLGRVQTRTTHTGSSDIIEELVYDLAGNVVWSSDNHVQVMASFDAHGRAARTRNPDGTGTRHQYDAFGQPTRIESLDANGSVIGETASSFTAAGRLESLATKVDSERTRETTMLWDGAGRITGSATNGRAARRQFDVAGRLSSARAGAGTAQTIETAFTSYEATGYTGSLVTSASLTEKESAAPVGVELAYDTLANPTREKIGTLEWNRTFDQAGNLTSDRLPNRIEPTTFRSDARGNVLEETKPDDAVIEHGYHASGAASSYEDPTDELTATTTDLIGRPLVRTYHDGTTETFDYDGPRLRSMTDRERRTFVFGYDEAGRMKELRANGGPLLESFDYDAAGRLTRWRTRDAELGYDDFDMEGRPRKTTQTRFRDRSGFGAAEVLDSYVQIHEWNVHGERSAWTMPSYAALPAISPWTTRVMEQHDEAGNVTSIRRRLAGSASDSILLAANYRNTGRPIVRTLTTDCASAQGCAPAQIVRDYAYHLSTGQLGEMKVTARGLVIAGSSITFDGLQIGRAQLLGLSGGARANEYTYDRRSRLQTSKIAREREAPASTEVLTASDFRTELMRRSVEPADPPSLAFAEQAGHKIAAMTRGDVTRTFSYGEGSQRINDGRFTYEYDARGRLIRATENPRTDAGLRRRIEYFYSASDRVVGRRAEAGNAAGTDWQLENRPDILAADALPAETTFVWDPVSDQLIAIYKAGASTTPATDPNGGLLRQIIHGRAAYDDPLEVTIADGFTAPIHRIYPVFDEAGAATLQVIANANGEVISRHLLQGAYGEDESSLTAPAIDNISITATRNAQGALETITVSVRSTEALDPATLPTGARLDAVTAENAVVRSAAAVPTLFENHSIRWTLTASDWTTLTAPAATHLAVKITPTLRAAAWPAGHEFLPSDPRTSLATLATWLDGIPAGETRTLPIATVPTLSALATEGSLGDGRVVAGFQALPFQEMATGLVYARARWYDGGAGAFLSADPKGFVDSSNLYAFAGGDPVNGRDPRGEGKLDRAIGFLFPGWDEAGRARTSAELHRAADAIDRFAAEVMRGTTDTQWFTRSAAQTTQLVSGFLRSGTQSGVELGTGTSVSQVIQNRVYEGMPLEEARALIQDWDDLSDADKARLISLGISKTAGTIAGARGFQQALYKPAASAVPDGVPTTNRAPTAATPLDEAVETIQPRALLAPPKTIRHHLFNKFRGSSPQSQKYRDFFKKHNISVDDFTVEIPEGMHRSFIHRAGNNWTTRWKAWIDANPNATTTEVYQFAGQLMDEYGLSGLPIIPYR